MGINQLEDSGAVIGYKPTLEYKKSNNAEEQVLDTSSATDYSGKVKYSKTLNSFANNLPSNALVNIDYAINSMKTLIDKLATSFKNGNWSQYGEISSFLSAIESGNEEYINNFIEYHKNNITGSIVPELIGAIHNTEQRLESLQETLKELCYGNSNLTLEEVQSIDNAYLQKMQSYETSNDTQKINYLSISYDSLLSRSVSMYAFGVNKKAIDMANVVTKLEDSSTNPSKASLIKKLFEEVNEEIEYRKASYREQQSVEIMQKTLYNYYIERQKIIALYDIFSENQESVFIGSKIEKCKKHLDNAVTNINRTFVGNQHFLSEVASLEQEKHFLMNIYASFNYNSQN